MPIIIAYHTGLRLGEVMGLTWDSIDFANHTLSVVRQLIYTSATGYIFGPPKTSSSIRTIPINELLVDVLHRWKTQQAENELLYGKSYYYCYEDSTCHLWQIHKAQAVSADMRHHRLVCTMKNGKAVRSNSMQKILGRHNVNFHSSRHSHATLCAENGAPSKGLAGRLGHRDTSITENLYTHETTQMQVDTLAAFNRATNIKK